MTNFQHPLDSVENRRRKLFDDAERRFVEDIHATVQQALVRHEEAIDAALLKALANGRNGIAVVERLELVGTPFDDEIVLMADIHEDVRVPYGTIAYVKDLDHLEHADLPEAPRETLVAALAHLAGKVIERQA